MKKFMSGWAYCSKTAEVEADTLEAAQENIQDEINVDTFNYDEVGV